MDKGLLRFSTPGSRLARGPFLRAAPPRPPPPPPPPPPHPPPRAGPPPPLQVLSQHGFERRARRLVHHPRAAREVAVERRAGDPAAHPRHAAGVQQVGQVLQLVHALEV